MDYLYALQVARESAPDVVTAFFVFVSEYLMMLGPVLAAIIFWCIDKRTGIWMMLSFGWAQVATNLVKIIACIPRPWLLDGRLHVAEQAAGSATGYSFPSGHTATATSTFGAAGVYALNTGKLSAIGNVKRRHTALAIVFFVIVLLVAFSRNWLGAHTFKDVAVAMLLTAALMVALYFVLKLLDKRPKADVWVMVVMLAILAAAGVYAHVCSFPDVYDVNGALIDVDNYDLATDLWGALGMAAGIVISWFVERRWINFNAAGTTRQRVLRGIIGAAIFGIVYAWLSGAIVAGIASAHLAKFIARFISAITACLLIPLGIKLVQNARAKHQTTAE